MNNPVAEKLLHVLLHRDDEMNKLNERRENPIRYIDMEICLTPMDFCMRCDWTINRNHDVYGSYVCHCLYTTEYNLKPAEPVVFKSIERQATEEEKARIEQEKKAKAAAKTTYYEGIYLIEYGAVRSKSRMTYNENPIQTKVFNDGQKQFVFNLVARVKVGDVSDTVLTIVGYVVGDVIMKAKEELDIPWKLRKNKLGQFVVSELKRINKSYKLDVAL
jgi:hypothetical protein